MIKSTKKCQNHTILARNGVPGRVRTAGSLLRRQILCPAEVRRQIEFLWFYSWNIHELDSNDLMLRRLTLYHTEVRRLNEIIGKCTVITRLDALCVSTGSEYVMQQHKGSTSHPENHMMI